MEYVARQTLADFIKRELGDGTISAWSRKNGLHPQDVRRARNAETGLSLDKLDTFAAQLGVEAWQLLYPGFERGSPLFPTYSVEAIDLARQVDKIKDEDRRRKVFATMLQVLEMATDAPAEKEPLVEPPKPSLQSMRPPARSGRT